MTDRNGRETLPIPDRPHMGLITYDAKESAADFSARLKREHSGQSVLVVGHSNTIPGIASALCSCAVAEMSETEYDRLTKVSITADGKATLEEEKQ